MYAGDYSQTLIKALAAIKAGTGPQFAVLLAAEMHSLQDQDILVSLDEIGLDADAKKWLDGFYPAFMANSHADGKTWSVPFQRSTAIFYYNKAAFQDAGLDPEKFPTTWADLAATAEKLTKRDASGRVTRWGIKMAGDLGNAQWTFGALANQAEQKLMNEAGTEVYFNQPKTIEAMAFWHSLSAKHHATPDGVIQLAQTCRRTSCRATRRSSSSPPAACRTSAKRRPSHLAWRGLPARTRRTPLWAAATCTSSRTPARPSVRPA